MEESTIEDNVTTTETTGGFMHDFIPTWYIVILLLIGLFGMLGNVMTFIVLLKTKIWTSVNLLIGIMSISDLCVIPLVASVMFQSFLTQRFYTLEIPSYLRHIFMTSSIVSAVIIGFERAFAVRRPLKFKEKWTTKLTMTIYTVTYLIFLAIVLSRPLISKLISRDYFEENWYSLYFFVVRGSPFFFILIANILVIRGLLINSRRMKDAASESVDRQRMKTETAITRTVLVLTSVYFLCMVPCRILMGLSKNGIFVVDRHILIPLLSFLEMTNFSVNMIIYTMTSKFYRQEYTKLVVSCFCCLRRQSSMRWATSDTNIGTFSSSS